MQPPLTPGSGTAPPRFRIDDLEVDVGKAEVTRGGKQIALPKLSFDLLCALINAAPTIVTNDELLQQVWPGLQVSPESVAQRVKLLRSAIGDDSQQPRYILGVRGRGYRLIPVPERLAELRAPISNADNPSSSSLSLTTEDAGHGSVTTSQAGPMRRAGGIGRHPGIAAVVFVAFGFAVVSGLRYWSASHNISRPATAVIVGKSIAVLPFTDMSEKKDQEYFADGMAEEILNLLAKIPGLKVIARTSSFQFKGKTNDLRSIGTQLGVAYVLEGSVRKSGDRLRVSAQLIDCRDSKQLLSRSYDRDMSDVLKMQDEIAVQVVRALQIEVTASDFASRGALRDSGAYTAYLKGVHAYNRLDQQGVEQANIDFQRALDLNPQFADARVWLAITYLTLGAFGFVSPAIADAQVRRSAEIALKLDPNIAIAHTLLGLVDLDDGNWAAADRELKLARTLAPRDFGIVVLAGAQAGFMGNWDEVLKQANARLELDPLDPIGYRDLSAVQLRRGRLAEAEAAARRALEISPTYAFIHYLLGVVLLARSEPDAALKEFAQEPLDGARLKGSAMAYFALGRRADSDAALAEWLEKYPPTIRYPFALAEVYAFRHQPEEALNSLEEAYRKREVGLPNPNAFPLLDSLHAEPRYKAFLKKMNLPE